MKVNQLGNIEIVNLYYIAVMSSESVTFSRVWSFEY